MEYQLLEFPMEVLNLTQGYGAKSSTHVYSYAEDFAGRDAGKDEVYAPFDCKVAKVYAQKGKSYEVWLVSTKKVLCRNGYYGIMTMSITHPSEIKNMKVGQKFSQRDFVCHEGKEGATANHIHLELSIGNSPGWEIIKKNGKTYYVNKHRVKPEENMFVRDNAIIKNDTYKGKKYNFVKPKDITKKVTAKDGLNLHKSCDINKKSIIATIPYNTPVLELNKKNGMSFVCYKDKLGYVSSKFLK